MFGFHVKIKIAKKSLLSIWQLKSFFHPSV